MRRATGDRQNRNGEIAHPDRSSAQPTEALCLLSQKLPRPATMTEHQRLVNRRQLRRVENCPERHRAGNVGDRPVVGLASIVLALEGPEADSIECSDKRLQHA